MRRIDEPCLGAGFHGALRFERGNFSAFERDTGDDGDLAVNRLHEALDHLRLLVRREERAFACMAEYDQAFDTVEAAEPGAQALDRRVVDVAVAGEGSDGCGYETSEIKGFHGGFLLLVRCWPDHPWMSRGRSPEGKLWKSPLCQKT